MRHVPALATLALSLAVLLPPAAALGGGEPPYPRLSEEDASALPARVASDAWDVAIELPKPGRPGAPAVAHIRLAGKGGRHVDPDYQPRFKLDPSATVTLASDPLPLASSARTPCPGKAEQACEVVLALPYTPGQKPLRLTGFLSFSVCGAEGCHIRRAAISARR